MSLASSGLKSPSPKTGKGSAHESRELERAREVVRARLVARGWALAVLPAIRSSKRIWLSSTIPC